MAFGLRPIRTLLGTPWNDQVIKCYIPSTDSNNMFIGDPVDFAGSADGDGSCPTVQLATAGSGNPIAGVIVGFAPDPDNLKLVYRAASTARYCYVCVSPFTVYEVQANTTAVLSADVVGANAVLASGNGSTATGLSGWTLDSGTTPAANSQYQLLIIGAVPRADNKISTAGAVWQVVISLHRLACVYTTAYYGLRGV